MKNELVSIIMVSHERGRYVRETVESVLAQTYRNWELLFIDDNSTDDTITQITELKGRDKRINILHSVYDKGASYLRNTALKEARGRWIAFLDVGDVWAPDKLEKQIAFMEENGYAFSYTKYGVMNKASQDRGIVVGGMAHINRQEMLKCCWPAYMTVMYDSKVTGRMQVLNLKSNNDYALWLNISEKADCHLLDACLAKQRTYWNYLGSVLYTDKMKWRYDCYRIEEDFSPLKATWYTVRNGCYGIWKWMRYVKRG